MIEVHKDKKVIIIINSMDFGIDLPKAEEIIEEITTDTKRVLRIERWSDSNKHWRVGIDWFGEEDYEYIVEKSTLIEALVSAKDYLLKRNKNII